MSTVPSPAEGGDLGPSEAEIIAFMTGSDSVRFLDVGTIAEVLRENDVQGPGGVYLDPIDLAKAIIAAQTEAGLGTFVLADLRRHIDTLIARRAAREQPRLEPETGRRWRYTSPNGDRVLVRWSGEHWEATPVVGTGYDSWERDDAIPTWPGQFVLVAG